MATIPHRRIPLHDGRTLTIRSVEPEEAAAVVEYVEAVGGESDFFSFAPGEFGFTAEQERQFIEKCRAAEHDLMIGSFVGNEIAGLLIFNCVPRSRTRHSGEFGMSVRKSHWGHGLGAALVDSLIQWARGSGVVRKINLRVRTDNVRAIALYEKKGFVLEGTIRKDFYLDRRYYDHHWMGLEL